jgi:hypothetical protein
VSIDGQTFTLGDGKTLTGPAAPIPPLQVAPGAAPVATMTLVGGGAASTSGVLAWQLVNAPGTAARTGFKGIQFVKHYDKSSPYLFKACANGRHIPKVVITVRKASADGGPRTIVLTDATVASYGTDKGKGGTEKPIETISLNFSEAKTD